MNPPADLQAKIITILSERGPMAYNEIEPLLAGSVHGTIQVYLELESLRKAGLISRRLLPRALVYELTGSGWARIEEING